MGTGNSKKSKEEEEEKDNINDFEPINVRINKKRLQTLLLLILAFNQ